MVAPINPSRYKLDDEDRLLLPRAALPGWFQDAISNIELFCVPINWRRLAQLPPGRELEAWCVWAESAPDDWTINPATVLRKAGDSAELFAMQSLIFPAKYDSKGRLSCAGVMSHLAEKAGGRRLWVAPEAGSISIWTDAAFQFSYGRLSL